MKTEGTGPGATTALDATSAKAMAHPIRVKIMGELAQRVMTIKQFVTKFPEYSHSQVYGHFRKLEVLGYVELIEIKTGGQRRGAKEGFYRAAKRAWFDQENWAILPLPFREGATGETLMNFGTRISEAVEAGTMDGRDDRHVSWTDGQFDQQAWDETTEDFKKFVEGLPKRQAEASVRLAESGEEPIRVTVGLTFFESPKPSPEDE